jgi:GAF domain-containing protein
MAQLGNDQMSGEPGTANGSTPDNSDYCAPFLDALPVSGAAISTVGDLARVPETLCASDVQAARLDELQFDLGEGPCWQVKATKLPVLEPDVRTHPNRAWPLFSDALQKLPVRAMFAFPLMIGPMNVGVVDLYSLSPGSLDRKLEEDAARLAQTASRQVLREMVSRMADEFERESPVQREFSRRTVYQATGMVVAQLQISAEDAALVLRAHAFAAGRSVRDVAEDVLAWRLDFSAGGENV